MPSAKRQLAAQSLAQDISRIKASFSWHPKHPISTLNALRLLHSLPELAPQKERKALTAALYKAYWVDNFDISNLDTLYTIAHATLPTHRFIDRNELVNGKKYSLMLRQCTQEAVDRGAPGVPCMYLPDLPGNQDTQRLFFGQDRFHFVIGALKNNIVKLPRLIPEGPLQVKRKLRFFFDFSSPWTFIGYTQLARMKMELGPLFEIECVPILLGALFREIGTPNLPAAALTAQKREYATKDMNAWIIYWNSLPVTSNRKPVSFTFEFPSLFPIRTVLPLRVAIVNPATIDCIFRAAWSRDINIGDAAALKLVLNEAGFDGEDLLKKADGDSVKKQLRANNELAVHLGLCGAPTYEVDGLIYWGQDRYNVVMDALCAPQSTIKLVNKL